MAYRDIIGTGTVLFPDATFVNDPDTEDLAAHAANVTTAHGLGITWEEKYFARGLTRSGLTAGQASVFFDEFTDIARWRKIGGGVANLTAITNVPGGVGEINAAAGDQIQYVNGSPALVFSPSIAAANGRWYMAGRMKMPGVLDPSAIAVLQIQESASSGGVEVGFDGSFGGGPNFNLVNWNGADPAEVLESTVALDAAWHDMEAWSDGSGTYFLSVDGETPVSFAPVFIMIGKVFPELFVWGSGAGGTQIQFDKVLFVFPQAA